MNDYTKEMFSNSSMRITYLNIERSADQTYHFIEGMIFGVYAIYQMDLHEKIELDDANLKLYQEYKNQDNDE